jgi:hypothetical protein
LGERASPITTKRKLRIVIVGTRVGDELTRPFRDARRFPLGVRSVPRAAGLLGSLFVVPAGALPLPIPDLATRL